ncbi:rhamnogalacturonan acetylesterase [Reichenbachiella ulvae]|uniref:Rhamnogalacturonan acetylesterase n=1 Tax=Reichenbachiella ulvae TaxID=2980104 RepID=A0ABT3CUV3_9BACT|nr:rhamnogalacturonan acetylesterase [Reichenbachiella ulvae]MCV9387349.1 rhamnogalacturonan acetylesterase [Reichenbachiella ulvae]
MTLLSKILTIALLFVGLVPPEKPTVYLVGDSTVRCGSGKGGGGLWGWGSFLSDELDTTKVSVVNKAMGGRSSRTYIQEGRWNDVHDQLQEGDYVIIQFGHNDSGPVNDDFRARGTIKGNGEETEEIDNILTKRREIVKSYGWYIRKYVADTKAKGAIPIVCSLVARNIWEDGKITRNTNDYTQWAKEAAEMEGAYFIDLNDLVATKYEELGQDYVTKKLFIEDHTHTNKAGAKINAELVSEAIKKLEDCGLSALVK